MLAAVAVSDAPPVAVAGENSSDDAAEVAIAATRLDGAFADAYDRNVNVLLAPPLLAVVVAAAAVVVVGAGVATGLVVAGTVSGAGACVTDRILICLLPISFDTRIVSDGCTGIACFTSNVDL